MGDAFQLLSAGGAKRVGAGAAHRRAFSGWQPLLPHPGGQHLLWRRSFPSVAACRSDAKHHGATLFAYHVQDPARYGVLGFDDAGRVQTLIEKPAEPPSHYAVTGLYFYDGQASARAHRLQPSARGELEITDLNMSYLEDEALDVCLMGRGSAWLDTGTHDSLQEASSFIQTLEKRQGLKVSAPEEIAWRLGWISDEQLAALAEPLLKSGYGEYLLQLLAPALSRPGQPPLVLYLTRLE